MKRSDYNRKRAFALRLFGIFMLAMGMITAIYSPLYIIMEKKHSTAVATGVVTRAWEGTDSDGKAVRKVNIYYELEGEKDGWLVTYESDSLDVGDEVNVRYNPDNTQEKYIEGFEESPTAYLLLGLMGSGLGAGALFLAHKAKHSDAVNDVLDVFDKPV